MACHVTAGWVAPSVHIADSVKSAYPSLATLSLIPDGLSHDARCLHVVVYCDAVMVGWVSPLVGIADVMAMDCLLMYVL